MSNLHKPINMISPYIYAGLSHAPVKRIETDLIIRAVQEVTNIPFEQMASTKRNRHLVTARHTVHYYCRKNTGLSLSLIGEIFKKDHASVINSIKKYKELLEFDKNFKEYDLQIRMKINLLTRSIG